MYFLLSLQCFHIHVFLEIKVKTLHLRGRFHELEPTFVPDSCSLQEPNNTKDIDLGGQNQVVKSQLFMRRTLLATMLMGLAMTASAQTSEVLKVEAQGFDFITKNLTVNNVTLPYAIIESDYSNGENPYEFTIYDTNFNQVKSFKVDRKEYTSTSFNQRATAPIIFGKVLYKNENQNDIFGQQFETVEDLKKFMEANASNEFVTFTDADGHFAFHENYSEWMRFEGYSYIENNTTRMIEVPSDNVSTGQRVPVVTQDYFYYNEADKQIYRCYARVSFSYDDSNLAWETQDTYNTTYREQVESIDFYDYDTNCAESFNPYLTQSFFNKDDKFEYIKQCYKEQSTTTESSIEVSEIQDGKAVLRRTIDDGKVYVPYYAIFNEDGKELFTIPGTSSYKDELEFFKANDKLYMATYDDNQNAYVIYSIDNTTSSITELARTNRAKAPKTFNMQGMQVNKNAKGLVIQQSGVKYLNK